MGEILSMKGIKMNIDVDFFLYDKVFIKELKRNGIVKSIWVTEKGIKYEVRYFDDAKIYENYFYKDEIKRL